MGTLKKTFRTTLYIRKDHEKWSIFCFYGMFCIVVVFEIIAFEILKSLCITTKTCTQIQNFKCNYLENYNDLEVVAKTKNAPFFMNFPNINKNGQLFSQAYIEQTFVLSRLKMNMFPCCDKY